MMKIAFCLFKYFPYGGLQRDFMRIASALSDRGHVIHVYTMSWEGEKNPDFQLHLVAVNGLQNHARNAQFAAICGKIFQNEQYDLVVGFNKMPHLDVYYAADVCYQHRIQTQRPWYYRWLPRYRTLHALEKAVFARGKKTEILSISSQEQQHFVACYQTEEKRFHLLPPGISKDRLAPVNATEVRQEKRLSYQLADHDVLLLMVGSGFKTKGLDRSIRGLAALPHDLKSRARLFVVGEDDPKAFQALAAQLQVEKQVYFLGGRPDVPQFLLAADLLLHPAYHENTGTVLLEAMVAGLPVLTVDVCGYAHYVADANAGIVLSSPFQQIEFNQTLQKMIESFKQATWHDNGLRFAKEGDIYSLPERAADFIENARK